MDPISTENLNNSSRAASKSREHRRKPIYMQSKEKLKDESSNELENRKGSRESLISKNSKGSTNKSNYNN